MVLETLNQQRLTNSRPFDDGLPLRVQRLHQPLQTARDPCDFFGDGTFQAAVSAVARLPPHRVNLVAALASLQCLPCSRRHRS
ncbi:hypothetical protein [Salinisphaera sp. T31B1]|uniref:hypothetical protein n=1 Tax=Salinisphaera sp. T31B1 TaxID=727963 RepID=UPI00333F51DC